MTEGNDYSSLFAYITNYEKQSYSHKRIQIPPRNSVNSTKIHIVTQKNFLNLIVASVNLILTRIGQRVILVKYIKMNVEVN